jgi:hypothetical protein
MSNNFQVELQLQLLFFNQINYDLNHQKYFLVIHTEVEISPSFHNYSKL